MIRRIWSVVRPHRRPSQEVPPRLAAVMTTQCRDQLTEELRRSLRRGHEGMVYFVGLTTGKMTLAVSAVLPEAVTTHGSVDVGAAEIGKIVRGAASAGLQVVGQLHTHPGDAYHSDGDLAGMRIRYPGYVSLVVPEHGARLPSLDQAHVLMWTADGFRELETVGLYDGSRRE